MPRMILGLKLLQEGVWGDSVFEWLSLVTLVSAAGALYVRHNCHEHHCLRMSWHPDKDGHPVCKKHHPDHPSRGLRWAIVHFFATGGSATTAIRATSPASGARRSKVETGSAGSLRRVS